MKKSNFALMTKELEAEKLIVSRKGEIDRRCRLMALTEKGKKTLSEFIAHLERVFTEENSEVEHALEILSTYLNKKI